ncbi:MAG: hypothetical protein Q8M95_17145, partial [Candidatus Methanoperedens sp.]|nr:hypothetical protein [Candidatus Methanoperedens sp.]
LFNVSIPQGVDVKRNHSRGCSPNKLVSIPQGVDVKLVPQLSPNRQQSVSIPQGVDVKQGTSSTAQVFMKNLSNKTFIFNLGFVY